MPDTDLSLYRNGGGLLPNNAFGAVNVIPTFFYGENSRLRLGLMNTNNYEYLSAGSVTFSLSIGDHYLSANRGEWRLGTGAATSTDISYNATTTQLKNAVSGAYGNVTVTTYGPTVTAGYLITAATANTALTLLPESLSLSPACTFDIINLATHSAGVTAQSLVRLRRKPALSLTRYLSTTTLSNTTLSASGASSTCAPWFLIIPDDAKKYPEMIYFSVQLSGSVTLAPQYNGYILSNQPRTDLVDDINQEGRISLMLDNMKVFSTTSLGGLVNVYTPPGGRAAGAATLYGGRLRDFVDFKADPFGDSSIRITARPVTSSINVAVTMSGSGSWLRANGLYDLGVVTFSSQALDEYFRELRDDRISLTMEISIEENSAKTTLLQAPVTIRRNIG